MHSPACLVKRAQEILTGYLASPSDESDRAAQTALADLIALLDSEQEREIMRRAADPAAQFVAAWNAYVDGVTYPINVSKGFFAPGRVVQVGDQIALMHSELSEGYEAWRKGLNDDKLTTRSGLEVELGDCVIRIMNFARHFQFDVPTAIIEKTAFNAGRPYMHGDKRT